LRLVIGQVQFIDYTVKVESFICVDECKAAAYALKAYSGMEYGKFEAAHFREVPNQFTMSSKL